MRRFTLTLTENDITYIIRGLEAYRNELTNTLHDAGGSSDPEDVNMYETAKADLAHVEWLLKELKQTVDVKENTTQTPRT